MDLARQETQVISMVVINCPDYRRDRAPSWHGWISGMQQLERGVPTVPSEQLIVAVAQHPDGNRLQQPERFDVVGERVNLKQALSRVVGIGHNALQANANRLGALLRRKPGEIGAI